MAAPEVVAGTAALEQRLLRRDRELLETLAMWSPPEFGCPLPAAARAWRGFTPEQLELAWENWQLALRLQEALGTGATHWCAVYSETELRGYRLGNQDAAIEMARQEADDALAHFLTGCGR